jgi:hypothetical protein
LSRARFLQDGATRRELQLFENLLKEVHGVLPSRGRDSD